MSIMFGQNGERGCRGLERAKVLGRDLHSACLGEKFVHVACRDRPATSVLVRKAEQTLSSKPSELAQHAGQQRIAQLALDILSTLTLEGENDFVAFYRDVVF